jgi:hypothetical protein
MFRWNHKGVYSPIFKKAFEMNLLRRNMFTTSCCQWEKSNLHHFERPSRFRGPSASAACVRTDCKDAMKMSFRNACISYVTLLQTACIIGVRLERVQDKMIPISYFKTYWIQMSHDQRPSNVSFAAAGAGGTPTEITAFASEMLPVRTLRFSARR